MNSTLVSIIIVFFATIWGAFGPIYLKRATDRIHLHALKSIRALLHATLLNKNLVFGIFIYGTSFILYLIALPGADLSVLFPFSSLSFVWVTFLSKRMLGEEVTRKKWVGVTLLIIGVILVGLGS